MYFDKVGRYPERMENLVFAVNVMIRALVRASNTIANFEINTEDFAEDMKSKKQLQKLLKIVTFEKDAMFNDTQIFPSTQTKDKKSERLDLYLNFFKNVTQMMDCVDCQKCKVYGKMQVLGFGVGLRTLLKENGSQMSRNELVAFINTLSKWIESVVIIDRMKHRFFIRKITKAVVLTIVEAVIFGMIHWMCRRKNEDDKTTGCSHNLSEHLN